MRNSFKQILILSLFTIVAIATSCRKAEITTSTSNSDYEIIPVDTTESLISEWENIDITPTNMMNKANRSHGKTTAPISFKR